MKKLHAIYSLVLVIIFSACQPQLPDPDADAVFKSITKTYEMKEDGTVQYQYSHQLKYLTHYAFNRMYGETFIVYNPNEQELKVNEAYTTTQDGRTVPSPENAFNKVLPRFAAGAPAFNHLREMVITHTGLELDCMVHLDYTLISKPGYTPFLNENIVLAERSPVQKMQIVVKVPANKKLEYELLNATAEPKVKEKEGITTYTWTFEQLKEKSFESNQPHFNTSVPRLVFSTSSVDQALNELEIDASITKEIVAKTDEIIAGKETGIEKMLALQDYVANKISTFHIPVEHAGYAVRPNKTIWNANGGTAIEKTALLTAILNHYKMEATPIYAFPQTIFNNELGILKDAGHPYIFVKSGNEPMVISAISTRAKNNLLYSLKNDALVGFDGQPIAVEKEAYAEKSVLEIEANAILNKNKKISGNVKMALQGKINPYFDMVKDEKSAKKLTADFVSGSTVTNYKLIDLSMEKSEIKADFEVKEQLKAQENYVFMKIQGSAQGFDASHLDLLTKNRETPIKINSAIKEIYDLQLTYPSSYSLVSKAIDTTLQYEIGEIVFTIQPSEKGLHIYKKLVMHNEIISKEDYAAFRDICLMWYDKQLNELIFKVSK